MIVKTVEKGKTVIPTSYERLTQQQKLEVDKQLDDLLENAYQSGKPFFVQDIVGHDMYANGWNGTAIYEIFKQNLNRHKDAKKAIHFAGIDVGYLFKERVFNSKHTFKLEKGMKFGKTMNKYTPL